MGIVQTNAWTCELCGRVSLVNLHDVRPYEDPVVTPPKGEEWDYVMRDGVEKLACGGCLRHG